MRLLANIYPWSRVVMSRLSIKQYKQQNRVKAEEANPYQLVKMIFENILTNIAIAKFNIEQKEIAIKGEAISKTISLIEVLKSCIDKENGQEIATNLDELYEFSIGELFRANIENDTDKLESVAIIFREIKAGWDGIAQYAE